MGGECRNCGVKGAGGCESDWIGDMEMMELGMWGRAQTFRCHERRDIQYSLLPFNSSSIENYPNIY